MIVYIMEPLNFKVLVISFLFCFSQGMENNLRVILQTNPYCYTIHPSLDHQLTVQVFWVLFILAVLNVFGSFDILDWNLFPWKPMSWIQSVFTAWNVSFKAPGLLQICTDHQPGCFNSKSAENLVQILTFLSVKHWTFLRICK